MAINRSVLGHEIDPPRGPHRRNRRSAAATVGRPVDAPQTLGPETRENHKPKATDIVREAAAEIDRTMLALAGIADMSDAMVMIDAGRRIRYCNTGARRLLGCGPDIATTDLSDPFRPMVDEAGKLFSTRKNPIYRALSTGKPIINALMGLPLPFGGVRWLSANVRPVLSADQTGSAAVTVALADVTDHRRMETELGQANRLNALLQMQVKELEKANARLEALAAMDSLTGLKNYRAFQERLGEEYERALRYGTPLSLILMDVDHFKLYNDSFGHPAGDLVLTRLARILQDNARETDVVGHARVDESTQPTDRYGCVIARHGGEEFSLILPHTECDGAVKLAERLRRAIEGATWENRPITASFGVASVSPNSRASSTTSSGRAVEIAALIAAADEALYRSKTRGRNRVSAATRRRPNRPRTQPLRTSAIPAV